MISVECHLFEEKKSEKRICLSKGGFFALNFYPIK